MLKNTLTTGLSDNWIYLVLILAAVLSTACVTPLSVKRHDSVTLTNGDADSILDEFSDFLSTADSAADFACAEGFNALSFVEDVKPARYLRSGSVGTYNATADIASEADFEDVMATPGYVKVVNTITWCGGFGANIIGCAALDSTSMAVVRWQTGDEGALWAHEFGHTVGLSHRSNSSAIMNATLSGNQDEVNAEECEAFVSRALNNPFNNSGIVTGAASAGSTKAARELDFPTSHHLELEDDMDIVDFVSQTFIHGTPVHIAEKFAGRKNQEILVDMLSDNRESEHWGNIIFTLGVIGETDSVPHIIDWLVNTTSTKMDWTTVRQVSAGMMGLGYLGHQTGDDRALAYLSRTAYDGAASRGSERNVMNDAIAQGAAIGVAMLGSDKALMVLEDLQKQSGQKSDPAAFNELLELHHEARDFGIRDYFVR
ncbi:MAG: matrixin family metalloprotease [Myxococcota bacterium]|nr:matrixin family metalloprotease [Myxococcota bacterium]